MIQRYPHNEPLHKRGTLAARPLQPTLSSGARCSQASLISSYGLGQTFENQLVRVIDHFSEVRIRNASINFHRVPVLLIHVVAGRDLLVAIAQLERQVWITF